MKGRYDNDGNLIELFTEYEVAEMTGFLKECLRIYRDNFVLGIKEVEIWLLIDSENSEQINRELSSTEIRLLSSMNAAFCWSVM